MVKKLKVAIRRVAVNKFRLPCNHDLDIIKYDKKLLATVVKCPVCGASKIYPDEPARKRAKQRSIRKKPSQKNFQKKVY